MPSTQAPSHGAGQSRPVNSGKLFVACSRSRRPASRRGGPGRSTPGSGCPSGQPWWQNGTPQSMQRAACLRTGREHSSPSRGRPPASPAAAPSTGRRAGSRLVLRGTRSGQPRPLHDSTSTSCSVGLGPPPRLERAAVVARHHPREPAGAAPVGQQRGAPRPSRSRARGARAPRGATAASSPSTGSRSTISMFTRPGQVEHVSDAAGHPAAKLRPVLPRTPRAAGHVLAARGRPRAGVHDRRYARSCSARPGATSRAGMSGGVDYVLDLRPAPGQQRDGRHRAPGRRERSWCATSRSATARATESTVAHALLADWGRWSEQFSVIMPRDYRRAMDAQRTAEANGTTWTLQ